MKKLITFGILALALATASAATTREKMTVDGTSREIKVHVPDDLPADAPLVIACHGANQDANWHDSNSQWTAVSDTAKFVMVFPEGIDKYWDVSGNRDVNFILAIIDKMHEEHGTSLSRVYLSGFSMGGMLTYHCANRIPDRIAAFVPVSGYPMGDKSATASRPVPIMHVHGTGDDVCVFSGVQPTLDNWIAHNQCNPNPEVIKPYPANKPSSGATLTKWTDGLDGVEVQLLEFKDKGHWQSEDPNFCLTSIEAWNFMKRWSLGPDAPKVSAFEPESGSFDLPLDGMQVTMTFDMDVDASEAFARLEQDGDEAVNLSISTAGNVLTLTVPAVERGEYLLTVGNVKGENGGVLKTYKVTYCFGYEEVGLEPSYDVIFHPNLRAEQNTIGEGIPTGWHRVNSRSNGEKDEKESGSANTGGARMKYFEQGGDFDEGFYLSARDYDRCEITYGKYTPDYPLHLNKGKYLATFNSAFWNEGSMSGDVKFDFTVTRSSGAVVATFPSLPSSSNLNEGTGRIEGSTRHECEFSVKADGNYRITWGMAQGWAAVIVGNLKITTAMSQAEKYKGEFLRVYKQAQDLYASIPEESHSKAAYTNLQRVINKYDGLVSTAPSVYSKAITDITKAIARASSLSGIDDVEADHGEVISTEHFNALGQPVSADAKGLTITLIHYSDGTTKTVKRMR